MRRDDRSQRPDEEFAAWLDALVRGQEPPGDETNQSDSHLGEIKATALYAHHVARQAALGAAERQRMKEEVMAAIHQPTARLTIGGQRDDQRGSRPARARLLRPFSRVRLSPLVSGAMVALLLVAIIAGYGGMQRAYGPGNGNGQPASVPASSALNAAVTLPNPQNCDVKPLTNAELQKIVTAPYEQRTNAISKKPVPVDVVDGAAILQVYQEIRDCALSWDGGDAVFALMSPHAVQEMYWRGVSMSGIFDTRTSQPGSVAATPAASSSAFVWQPNFSKTDTYFGETHAVWMETMKDGRVVAWLNWTNTEGKGVNSPLNGLVFIKIDGQWKLDDWIFGTQILTDAGR